MTATTVSQAVAKTEAGPINLMWSRRTHFDAVLPDHVDVKSFLGTAAGALYGNEKLMEAAEANPDSLIIAMMRCAALGHQPGTDEFYLTPRKDHGKPKILGIEGYRGIIERMYRSGAVRKVVVREVCSKDKFRYVEGVDERPVHSFGGEGTTGADFFGAEGSRDRGDMVGVYAYAELLTGAVSRVVLLGRSDVEAARDAGGYKADDKFTPWNRLDGGDDHPEFKGRSMWWKTAARRLEPWVPTSAEYRREQLRAASAASDLSAARITAGNGAGQPAVAATPPPDMDIHDAELVDDTQQQAAPEPPARPTPSALGKLGKLLTRVPVGADGGLAEFLVWQSGRPEATALEALTRDEAAIITRVLDDALAHAQGDGTEAASALWARFHADMQDQDAEGAQPDGSDG